MTQIRRVVTGHDRNGKAIVLSDGAVPTVHSNPIRPGQQSFEVWKTHAMPVPLAADEPEPTTGPRSLQPPARISCRSWMASFGLGETVQIKRLR